MREWIARLLHMFQKRRMQERLEQELQLHRDLLAGDLAASGSTSTPDKEMGASSFRDEYYDRAGVPWIEHLSSDIRYGFRAMRRSPSFSFIVILTLALGIGVNTAIFSVVHGVLLKPLPYPDSERLVWLGESTGKASGISVTWVNFQNWRNGNRSFETMAGFEFTRFTLTGRTEALLTRGMAVSAPYFSLLGMHPLLGRLFGETDDKPAATPTIVLNHRFWASALGGDTNIVGATLTLDGKAYEVVGVAAPVWEWRPVDYYIPLGLLRGASADRSRHGSTRLIGRLKPAVTLAAARADLDGIMQHLAGIDPGPENEHRSAARFLSEDITGDVRGTLIILMGAATLVLLIACANVASLLLARSTTRLSEFAVRTAIGAGRTRLVRQLLSENVLLAATGGLAGLLLAHWTRVMLIAIAPSAIPRLAETTLDLPVLLFATAITLITGLIAGLAPIITAGRIDLSAALKDGSRSASSNRQRQYLRSGLVIGEVALTFMLAFGSGILLRSLIAAQKANPGVDAQHTLSLELLLPESTYKSSEAVTNFYSRLYAGLRAIPGVTAVTSVHCPPGGGDCGDWFYSIPGRPAPSRNEVPIALFNSVDPEYFRTMKAPLRQGRHFDETDRATGPKVAIVNETFARTWWPNQSAIGHQIKVGGPYIEGPLFEIAGVIGDIKQEGLDSKPYPEIYQPVSQKSQHAMAVMIRTAGDTEALIPTVRSAVSAVDRNLPVRRLSSLERTLGASLARRRFSTLLLTIFAALAMVLAVVGIYGLLSYWVSIREREIAIRVALGARPSVIIRWTSLQALRLALIGIAFGVLGGWLAARGLEDLVYGIPPRSPATMIAAALGVAMFAVAAAAIPASRAARVDAASRLHYC